jgi:hypothetical protein
MLDITERIIEVNEGVEMRFLKAVLGYKIWIIIIINMLENNWE